MSGSRLPAQRASGAGRLAFVIVPESVSHLGESVGRIARMSELSMRPTSAEESRWRPPARKYMTVFAQS